MFIFFFCIFVRPLCGIEIGSQYKGLVIGGDSIQTVRERGPLGYSQYHGGRGYVPTYKLHKLKNFFLGILHVQKYYLSSIWIYNVLTSDRETLDIALLLSPTHLYSTLIGKTTTVVGLEYYFQRCINLKNDFISGIHGQFLTIIKEKQVDTKNKVKVGEVQF